MEVKIYTDGSSLGNPGPGGFCAILKYTEGKTAAKKTIVKGGDKMTTNNRMEMSAVIAALFWVHKNLPESNKAEVFSDSQLVIKTMQLGWKKKMNKDLWEKLDSIAGHFEKISWHWVKGHAGHPENEEADRVAYREATKRKSANTA